MPELSPLLEGLEMSGSTFQKNFISGEPIVRQRRWVGFKLQFKPLKHTQMFPLWRFMFLRTIYCFETVIVDHVVGRAKIASLEILHQ